MLAYIVNKLDIYPNIQHMSEIKTGSLCMVPLLPHRLLDFDNKNAVAQGPEDVRSTQLIYTHPNRSALDHINNASV